MKWFFRFNRALMIYGMLSSWFSEASKDGVLTADEIAEGIEMLVSAMGYEGKIKVEPFAGPE